MFCKEFKSDNWKQSLTLLRLTRVLEAFISPILFVCTIPTELKRCYSSRQCIRISRNVWVCTANKWLDLEAPILHSYPCWQDTSACPFSSRSLTSFIFIFKVKYSNWVHWAIHTWLSHKQWQIGQTLLLPTHRKSHVAFQLACYDNYYYCQHIGSHMWPFSWHVRTIITIANKKKVTYYLSIGIFTFDLCPF